MNSTLKYMFPAGFMALSIAANSQQLPGIKEFADGQPALASEVNNNNRVISETMTAAADALAERISLLERTSDRLVVIDPSGTSRLGGLKMSDAPSGRATETTTAEVLGGKLIIENVDCTADPYALNRQYVEYSRFSYLLFYIRGDCYGEISSLRLGDENFDAEVAGGFNVQEHAQVIAIYQNDADRISGAPRPKIIPNPDCALNGELINAYGAEAAATCSRTYLFASFGGALYIDSIDIEVGPWDNQGILFSRGAQGEVSNSIITMAALDYTSGIKIQHGASPYLSNVVILGNESSEGQIGLNMINNGAAYLYGPVDIAGTQIALEMQSGASIFSYSRGRMRLSVKDDNGDVARVIGSNVTLTGGNVTPPAIEFGNGRAYFSGSFLSVINRHVSLIDTARLIVQSSIIDINPQLNRSEMPPNEVTTHVQCFGNSDVTLGALREPERPYNRAIIDNGAGCLDNEEWKALIQASQTP